MTLREYLEEDARSRKLLLGPNSDPHFGNGDKTTCRHMVGGGKRRTGGFHRHLKLGSLTSTNDNASSVSSARGSTISNPQPRERSITPRAVIVRISRGLQLVPTTDQNHDARKRTGSAELPRFVYVGTKVYMENTCTFPSARMLYFVALNVKSSLFALLVLQ
jgi:hypothetical protein